MRGTIMAVSADCIQVWVDDYQLVTLPAWYVAEHTQHAYAITGHSAQGATVRWTTVIGRPGDFTKNWAYTALSRAQLPTHMVVIDDPTPSQLERQETGPLETPETDVLARLEARMRQRDDEDLAISQIDAAASRRIWEQTLSPHAKRRLARTNRARQRQELAQNREQMRQIVGQLKSFDHQHELQDARKLLDLRDRILIWQQHAEAREAQRGRLSGQQLDELKLLLGQEDTLTERIGSEPEDILDHDRALRDYLSDLANTSIELQQAVEPRWLIEQIGQMPADPQLHVWVQAAEAIHEHRFNRGIHNTEDPSLPNMPTSLRALLRRTRREFDLVSRDAETGLGR